MSSGLYVPAVFVTASVWCQRFIKVKIVAMKTKLNAMTDFKKSRWSLKTAVALGVGKIKI